MEIYIKTAWMHPLFHHFEFCIFNAIQCRTSFCFQTCLNKGVAGEVFFVDETQIRRFEFMHWNFDFLHSFDITKMYMQINADDAQT